MKKNRAFSMLTIKAVDEGQRVIRGVATTPTPDRLGDIVEPLGVKFTNPLPLLWQHRSGEPVGLVKFSKPTKAGVEFEATIPNVEEAGRLKERVDEAWQSVKLGLVRAVSIGFKAIEYSFMEDGGIRFMESEVFELSLVTIPANAEATIQAVKSIDRQIRAASGQLRTASKPAPSVLGQPANPRDKRVDQMKTFAEKIAELEAELTPKNKRMALIMQTGIDDGDRDLDDSEKQEFDELSDEVKALDEKLQRLKVLAGTASTAKPVRAETPEDASRSRGGTVPAQAKAHEEKGLGFARMVMCKALAGIAMRRGETANPLEIAKRRYPNMRREQMADMERVFKELVAGGTTTDPSWAAPLVEPTNLVNEFVEFLRPMTIIGRFGLNGIPALRSIPFNVKFPAQISGGDGYWVGEGQPKPLTRFSYEQIILRWTKVANIAVLSEDLLRFSTPSAEMVVRNALAEALQSRLDADFVNPAITLIADERPASITNGAATAVSSGIDADAVRADLRTLLSGFITANINTGSVVIIMRQAQALSLSLLRNGLGQREFPDITMNGGMLEGIPVITSQHVPTGVVIAAVASEIYLADDGGVTVDLSREASLEMDTAPTNAIIDNGSPPVPVESALVSMFQTNSVAIRAERMINWRRRRTAAVFYLTAVGWGNDDTSPPQSPI